MHAKGGGREGAEGLQKFPLLGRDVWEQMARLVTQSGCQTLSSSLGTAGLSFSSLLRSCVFSQGE